MQHGSELAETLGSDDARHRSHRHGGHQMVAALPGAFAVSGGTYQRLVPWGSARRRTRLADPERARDQDAP